MIGDSESARYTFTCSTVLPSASKSIAVRAPLFRPQHVPDLISQATGNILHSIRRRIDLGRCQCSRQAELTGDPFDAVHGIDVLDQGDLITSRRALAGDDGRVGKEKFPDLRGHISMQG